MPLVPQVLVTIVRDGSSALNLKVVLGDEAASDIGMTKQPGLSQSPHRRFFPTSTAGASEGGGRGGERERDLNS